LHILFHRRWIVMHGLNHYKTYKNATAYHHGRLFRRINTIRAGPHTDVNDTLHGLLCANATSPTNAGPLRESDRASSSDLLSSLPPPRTGRSAWRGPDMVARRSEWELHLSPAEIAEVEAAVAALIQQAEQEVAAAAAGAQQQEEVRQEEQQQQPLEQRWWCGQVAEVVSPAVVAAVQRRLVALRPEQFPLPTLGPRLQALRSHLLHGPGFALLRRLPVERYSPLQCAASFLGLGAHLGSPRSQNARGHLLGHVADLGASSAANPHVRIYQTCERQTFHTDSCDVVGLLCLREARQGGDSLLVSADTLFNELRSACPQLLARLLAPMPHDRRGEVPAGERPFFEIPVFSWHADQLTVFYQRQYFDSAQRFPEARRLTEEDVAALNALDALADDPRLHLRMRLAPGDMQWVHNHNMLHDRTAFTEGGGEEEEEQAEQQREPGRCGRHLLRLWLAVPGARELPPAFAARYGSLTVGDRGGIVVPGLVDFQVPLLPE
ncbi:hypothetical protein Agub_g13403, partial [Astrephomene gubernaculifera]